MTTKLVGLRVRTPNRMTEGATVTRAERPQGAVGIRADGTWGRKEPDPDMVICDLVFAERPESPLRNAVLYYPREFYLTRVLLKR